MSEKQQHINYNAGDIQKYLSGQMTAAEMHAIEKAALDDPFLAEAIEGYEAMKDKGWSKELAELKRHFDKKEEAPVIPITKASFTKWWKAAAAVVVLGTSVTVAYLFSKNNSIENKTAAEVSTVSDSLSQASVSSSPAVDSAVAINEKTDSAFLSSSAVTANNGTSGLIASNEIPKQEFTLREIKPQNQTKDNGFVYKPSPQTTTDITDASKDVAVADEAIKQNREETPAAAKSLPAAGNSNTNAAANEAEFDKNYGLQGVTNKEVSNNNFNAQVVTEDDKPVAYAQVNVGKSKKPVYTDAAGNFKVTAQDTAVDVTVTSVGYATQRSKLKQSAAQNKIVLQPNDNALAETVAVGKKRDVLKKQQKTEVKDTVNEEDDEEEDAEPSGGWVEYNNYLNNNLVMPGDAKEKNIHGVVEVFVKLTESGSIKEVKVGKPLCTGCDAEAIRLVKEGPKWDVKANKPVKVKVKVTF